MGICSDKDHCEPQDLYSRGIELRRSGDYDGAFLCFSQAAKSKHPHPKACICLGECYEHGDGVEPSYEEAAKWYHKAADKFKICEAQFQLGYFYEHGFGVKQNNRESVNYYRKSADKGYAKAQYKLGMIYRDGIMVKQNNEEAEFWFGKAKSQGYDPRQSAVLGNAIEKGFRQVGKWLKGRMVPDASSAILYFNAPGFSNMGAGFGGRLPRVEIMPIPKEYEEAVKLTNKRKYKEAEVQLKKACDKGFAKAKFLLGKYYADGIGGTKDRSAACKLLQAAADENVIEAIWELERLAV
ncbi:MAG: sel1 repeat family protein [bacterium]|nr:sel1 repeat family protein [bacterium]